jgi:hypothetical protein
MSRRVREEQDAKRRSSRRSSSTNYGDSQQGNFLDSSRHSRASCQLKGERDTKRRSGSSRRSSNFPPGAYSTTSSSREERFKRKSLGASPRQGIRVQRGASSSDDSLGPDQKEKRMSRRSTRCVYLSFLEPIKSNSDYQQPNCCLD